MRYRRLGDTGIEVSVLSLGAMMFGPPHNADYDDVVAMVDSALDAGINVIDTADVYAGGHSEENVGRAIKGRRDQVILATKFGQPTGARNAGGASRSWIMRAVEASLRRLDTDYIDLYQQHIPDHTVAPEETLSALDDLVRSGKVRSVGSSNFPAEMIVEYQWAAARLGSARMRSEQLPYNLFCRQVEQGVLPTCSRYGMGVLVWSPLNAGWLTGKYRRGEPLPADSRAARGSRGINVDEDDPTTARKLDALDQITRLASEAGLPLTHLAQAWVLEHPSVSSAIVGPRTPAQLADVLAAADVVLDQAILDALDVVCPAGMTVNSADTGALNPNMRRSARRRPTPR